MTGRRHPACLPKDASRKQLLTISYRAAQIQPFRDQIAFRTASIVIAVRRCGRAYSPIQSIEVCAGFNWMLISTKLAIHLRPSNDQFVCKWSLASEGCRSPRQATGFFHGGQGSRRSLAPISSPQVRARAGASTACAGSIVRFSLDRAEV